jgi:hypothetical protein
MDLNMMKLHHPKKPCQLPGLNGQVTEPDFRTDEYQRQKIAGRFGVSLATAGTLAAIAGFSDGERR